MTLKEFIVKLQALEKDNGDKIVTMADYIEVVDPKVEPHGDGVVVISDVTEEAFEEEETPAIEEN